MLELPGGTTVISNLNPQMRHYKFPEHKYETLVACTDEQLSELPEMFDNETKATRCPFTPQFMHEQCCHLGWNKVKIIEKLYHIKLPSDECQDCIVGKSTKARMSKSSGVYAKHPLELIHVDLTTHLSTKTEFTCLLVAIDDTSSFTYVKPLQAKSDALQVLKEWIHYAEIQMGHKLKTLCSDNGSKWTSAAATGWQNNASFWWQKTSAYTTEAAVFMKNLMLNIHNWVSYHVFYNRDPRKPFSLLWTFGCLTWVNVPKAKHKKLDELAIPAIFIRYDEEHKGWKFLAPNHNLPVFWFNSAHFLQGMSWNNCTDMTPIQDMDALHYKDTDNIEDLGYDEVNEHDEEPQHPIDNIYQPLPEPDMAFEDNTPDPGPTETVFEYLAEGTDDASESDSSNAPSDRASDSSRDKTYWLTMPSEPPPLLNELNQSIQNRVAAEHLSMQTVQHYHNKFAMTHNLYPWLHLTMLAILLKTYLWMFPPKADIHHFQENLQHNGKLVDIGNFPAYDASAHAISTMNLKPLVKEALTRPDQIHWHEAIRAEMDGLESMNIWETVDRPEGANLVDSKLVLQVKTDANNIPYKFKAKFCVHGFSQQEGINYNEIFTPVIPRDAIQTLLVIAARFDWELDSIDIMQAYLNAELHHHVYLKLLEGTEVPANKVYKLVKSLYGLKQSSREWHKELDTHQQCIGLFPLANIPCMYSRGTGATQVIISVYVNNMLIMSPSCDQVDQVKREIVQKWKITDNGLATEFLKIKLTQDHIRWMIDLDQWAYIQQIIKEWI
ncbi:hypothetical protein NDA12_005322 [Ustilago hordei]|nr:hypothetical protein NDA12_005322 [Ustilago hordei]KAJ1577868.1 hypothetical protein NDA15_005629 [Ustilago hordei]